MVAVWKLVLLLTLVASSGVTDLYIYPSRGLNVQHARTAFRKFVELSINNDIVGLVHKHHIINEIMNKHAQRA